MTYDRETERPPGRFTSKSLSVTAESGQARDPMTTPDQGWIGEPQQQVQWRDSHYSRMADRIAQEQQDDHPD